MLPTIIIAAYNRVESINRLLDSLNHAEYGDYDGNVKLIVSIDFSNIDNVEKIVNNFIWKHGEKEIIKHASNLGLRKHILMCGDLVLKYENIILLEDDLFVSKYFYSYAIDALGYYKDNEKIAGISLYSHYFNEMAQLPFQPLEDKSDVFFLQIASSWGQIWSKKQWKCFKSWYAIKPVIDNCNIPDNVKNWPDTSWKKYFIQYMVENDLYFVYPRRALTTNFADSGTHDKSNNTFQVPLLINNIRFTFNNIEDSLALYDSFCEMLPDKMKKLNNRLDKYNFDVDLYGTKNMELIKKDFILTTKDIKQINSNTIVKSYALKMKPIEMNILFDITGNEINLVPRNIVNDYQEISKKLTLFEYFYKNINNEITKIILFKVFLHFKNKILKFRK